MGQSLCRRLLWREQPCRRRLLQGTFVSSPPQFFLLSRLETKKKKFTEEQKDGRPAEISTNQEQKNVQVSQVDGMVLPKQSLVSKCLLTWFGSESTRAACSQHIKAVRLMLLSLPCRNNNIMLRYVRYSSCTVFAFTAFMHTAHISAVHPPLFVALFRSRTIIRKKRRRNKAV